MATNAQTRRVLRALRSLEHKLSAAIKASIEKSAASIDLDALIAAIADQNIGLALDIARINPATLFPVDEAVRSAFMTGGGLVVADLSAALAGVYSFDGRHPDAELWVREHVGILIQRIQEESLEAVRDLIRDGISTGRSATSIGTDITGRKVGRRRVGGIIGLNSDQADSLIRARAILSDPKTMRKYYIRDRETGRFRPRYKLSDRRFDRMIKKAINAGSALTASQIDQIMRAHSSKALGYRGRLIARNETFTALAAGREQGYLQLLENPDVQRVTVRWQHNLSQNPREDHQDMDGTVIDIGDYFRFDDALMKHPHDPAGGAEHSIGCRCIAIYRVIMKRSN